MATEENKQVIHRLVEEFWNKGNAEVIDEIFAPTFIDHTAAPGTTGDLEGYKQENIPFLAAFSDVSATIDDLVAEGDKVAWRWTFRGVQTDTVQGVPATNKQITISGFALDRLADDQIVERWWQYDRLGMMQQLGLIPATGESG